MRTIRRRIAAASNPQKTIGTITFRGRSKKEAKQNMVNYLRRTNVMAGFYDEDGQFHPIRAAKDYSRSRAGEGSGQRRKSSAKRRR
jgi:hypothetical protein